MKNFLLKDIVIVITWNSNAYVHTLLRSILLPRNSSVALHLEEHLAFVACIKHFDGAVQDSQSGSRTGKTILLFSVNSPRFSTSVVSYLYPEHRVLYPDINIQRRRLTSFFHAHKRMLLAFSTGIWIIIDGSISFISTSLAIWNRGFGRNGLVSWRREE